MKKLINYTFLLWTVALTSCFDEQFEDKSFTGSLLEFNNTTLNADPLKTTLGVDDGAGQLTEQVNLVGPQFTTEQAISFGVDTDLTTAVEGTHFDLRGGMFVFPANQSVANMAITILDGAIPNGESFDLVLLLEGNNSIEPSENYKRLYIEINGL